MWGKDPALPGVKKNGQICLLCGAPSARWSFLTSEEAQTEANPVEISRFGAVYAIRNTQETGFYDKRSSILLRSPANVRGRQDGRQQAENENHQQTGRAPRMQRLHVALEIGDQQTDRNRAIADRGRQE